MRAREIEAFGEQLGVQTTGDVTDLTTDFRYECKNSHVAKPTLTRDQSGFTETSR